jgi:kynurenine formamidase
MEADMPRIYDLTLPWRNFSYLPVPSEITCWDHREGTRRIGRNLGLGEDDWPEGQALAMDRVVALTHAGTHLDAPYHYGPTWGGGQRALTIDEVPLEWLYGPGVVLDLTTPGDRELISVDDVRGALAKIGHELRPGEIVLLRTDMYKQYGRPEYVTTGPGMSWDATWWLVEQGIRVMGIDTYSFDRPTGAMVDAFRKGEPHALWPGHMVARERPYIHAEQLGYLDTLPTPTGFRVAFFPVKIERASGAWIRAVAIYEP